MIPLLKLTGVDDHTYYLNPGYISMFTASNPALCQALVGDADRCRPTASLIVCSGLPLQVKDNTQEIVEALQRLRRASESHALKLRKRIERQDWEGDQEEDWENDWN